MVAVFDDFAGFHNQDAVGDAGLIEPVCHDQGGAAAGDSARGGLEGLGVLATCFRGCLIHDQHWGLAQKHAGQGNLLGYLGTHLRVAGTDFGIQPLRQPAIPCRSAVAQTDGGKCREQLIIAGIGFGQQQIIAQGA